MASNYETLLEKVYEINDLDKTLSLLSWDREVNMPPGGITARVQQMTTIKKLSHQMFTADEMSALIEKTAAELNGYNYDSNEASLIRHLRRHFEDSRKLPE